MMQNTLPLLSSCNLIYKIPGAPADRFEFTHNLSHEAYSNKWRKSKNSRLERNWQSVKAVKDAQDAMSRQVIFVCICECIILFGIDTLLQVAFLMINNQCTAYVQSILVTCSSLNLSLER
jgi:hypothetical protein